VRRKEEIMRRNSPALAHTRMKPVKDRLNSVPTPSYLGVY
jgi:hypothetical protein